MGITLLSLLEIALLLSPLLITPIRDGNIPIIDNADNNDIIIMYSDIISGYFFDNRNKALLLSSLMMVIALLSFSAKLLVLLPLFLTAIGALVFPHYR